MTQPPIKIDQLDSDQLSLTIQSEVSSNIALDDLSNVSVPSPSASDTLAFVGSQWAAVGGLGTVTLTSIVAGDFLVLSVLGSPDTWVNTNTISLSGDRIILTGLSSGSPTDNNTSLEISSALPGILLNETDAATNEGAWRFKVTGGDLVAELKSDSGTTGNRWLEVLRTGILVDEISLFIGAGETAIHAIEDGAVELYHNNINVAETTTAAAGGLLVDNQLTGGGVERVLTTSDLTAGGSPSVASKLVFVGAGSPDTVGTTRVIALEDGIAQIRSDTNANVNRVIEFAHQDGTVQATIGHIGGATALNITNRIHGAGVSITAEDAGGNERTGFSFDPDSTTTIVADNNMTLFTLVNRAAIVMTGGSDVALHHNLDETARTLPVATGGFEVDNQLTGGGFERVLTLSDIANPGSPQTLAVLGTANTFTNNRSLVVSSTAPQLGLVESDAAADQGFFRLIINSAAFEMEIENDARSLSTSFFTVTRTGQNVDTVSILTANEENAIVATTDADVALFHNGLEAARTITTALGGFEVDNDLTGTSGFERVLTTSDGVFETKYKTATNTRANNTLTDDEHMVGFTIKADTMYSFEGFLIISNPLTTADVLFRFDPTQTFVDSRIKHSARGTVSNGAPVDDNGLATSSSFVNLLTTDEIMAVEISGFFKTHATLAGTVDFQWSQSTTEAGNLTSMYLGSWIRLQEMGPA